MNSSNLWPSLNLRENQLHGPSRQFWKLEKEAEGLLKGLEGKSA